MGTSSRQLSPWRELQLSTSFCVEILPYVRLSQRQCQDVAIGEEHVAAILEASDKGMPLLSHVFCFIHNDHAGGTGASPRSDVEGEESLSNRKDT